MPLRLIEMVISQDREDELDKLLEDQPILSIWKDTLPGDKQLIKILLRAENTETILDILEKRYSSSTDNFRIILLSVEAAIPRPQPEDKEKAETEKEKPSPDVGRMYREEVYNDIMDAIKLDKRWILLCVMSSLAAAVGIIYGSIAVIIGAMVIAPLLGPNVALALATTLGDTDLAQRALKTNTAGFLASLIVPVLLGLMIMGQVDVVQLPEVASRTQVRLGEVAVALVAGTVGGLAFTTGVSTALVGVMVAVALLPPLVVFGILMGSGNFGAALGSLLLLVTNLIGLNLAGVVTFLVQGIHPNSWWKERKAKRYTRQAISFWIILFIALVLIILISRGYIPSPW